MGTSLDKKILWVDLETTGLDPKTSAIIEIGALVDINGEIREEYSVRMAPFFAAVIDDRALEVNNFDYEDILTFPPVEDGMRSFLTFLKKHVNPYNTTDKFVLAGKNVSAFDRPFLQEYFGYIDLKRYFGSYFFSVTLDINTLIARVILDHGIRIRSYNLRSVVEYFRIPQGDFHTALGDCHMSRALYYELDSILFKGEKTFQQEGEHGIGKDERGAKERVREARFKAIVLEEGNGEESPPVLENVGEERCVHEVQGREGPGVHRDDEGGGADPLHKAKP